MGHFGLPEILLIVLVVVLLFGAKKLPEIGGAIGKAIQEFKRAGRISEESSEKDKHDKT